MLQIELTDYIFGSAAYAYWRTGTLKILFDSANVPKGFPYLFVTTSWKYVIPALYNKFPNDEMEVAFTVTQAPTVQIAPGAGITVSVVSELIFYVVVNKAPQVAFILQLNADCGLLVSVVGTTVVPRITTLGTSISVMSTNIGPFGESLPELNTAIADLINYGVLPLVNIVLSVGIPLPIVDGTGLVDPSITFYSRTISVDTSFE